MKPWYQSVHLWGQVNLTEDDPEKCDLAVWEDYWRKTRVEGVIINCGGIVSYYQSRFPYQYKARTLGDKDYFGIWVKAARRAGLAVVARMDITVRRDCIAPSDVLRDRQHLAEDGIMIVVLTLEKGSNQLLAGPDIVSRGFVYVRESESLMEEARKVLTEAVEDCLTHQRNADWSKIKLVIRDTMNDFIWKRTKRRPMILPIIMDV